MYRIVFYYVVLGWIKFLVYCDALQHNMLYCILNVPIVLILCQSHLRFKTTRQMGFHLLCILTPDSVRFGCTKGGRLQLFIPFPISVGSKRIEKSWQKLPVWCFSGYALGSAKSIQQAVGEHRPTVRYMVLRIHIQSDATQQTGREK